VIGRRGYGFVAEAPTFYVWDEDPAEVVRTACAWAALTGAGPAALRPDGREPRREPAAR
jgi:hypothetical protein